MSEAASVLLVDDNAQNLKMLYETLRGRGYRLLVANDGEKALAMARRERPELILLDIMMPDMGGFEVCRRLKADPETALSAVVFLSALDDVESKVTGFSLGGADYIAKPFQAQEVISRVDTHIRIIQLERRLEARNRQLENDQARILNAITEGIYGLDASGTIIFANPAATAMCRVGAEALIGRNFFTLHFDSGQFQGDLPVQATCRDGVAENGRDVDFRRPDGSSFPVEYRSAPKKEGDRLLGAVVVFRDISAELANERALEQARRTVQQQREQLAHASRLSTMGEMATGFAHEVNQPLTAIANYARVALRLVEEPGNDRTRLRQTLEKIEAQSHRASEVIRRIRDFVRKPASGQEAIDLAELLRESCRFAEVDAHTNAVALEADLPDGLPPVMADPIQVQQVALNLIRNALEASSRGNGQPEPVRVTAFARDGQVRAEVTDRGCGLPEDAEQRLFHPFFSTKQDGMGIGLALCRTLIQAQGGEIGFARREGGGSLFYFTLPIAQSPTDAERPPGH